MLLDLNAYNLSWRAPRPRGSLRGIAGAALLVLGAACSTSAVEANTTDSGSDSDNSAATSEGATTAGPSTTGTDGATTAASSDSTNTLTGTDPSGPGTSTGTEESSTGDDTGPFPPEDCDPYAQDCPEGFKCAPYSSDGQPNWNDSTCVPLDPEPSAPGESCMDIGEPFDGEDTCEAGAICWDIDPDTMLGTCEPLCGGTPEEPECPEDHVCSVSGNSSVSLCLETCDPIEFEQACAVGEACLPSPNSSVFFCIELIDTLKAGFPCEFLNVCAPGLFCAPADAVEGCDPMESEGCCTTFCVLDDPNCDALPGNECVPFFEEAPPGYENVGVCAAP